MGNPHVSSLRYARPTSHQRTIASGSLMRDFIVIAFILFHFFVYIKINLRPGSMVRLGIGFFFIYIILICYTEMNLRPASMGFGLRRTESELDFLKQAGKI